MSGTRTGGSITAAANDSAMSPDIDLQYDGILGAREIGEGLTTPRAAALVGRKDLVFDNGREVGIIASFRTGPTALLATRPSRRRVGVGCIRSGRSRRRGGLGFAPKELLLSKTDHCLEPLDFDFELGLALQGSGVLGLPVGGLTKRLEILIEPRANRTGGLGERRSRTNGFGNRVMRWRARGEAAQFRDRNPQGSEAEHGSRSIVHVGRE